MSILNFMKKLFSYLSALFALAFILWLISFYGPNFLSVVTENYSVIIFVIIFLAIYLIPSSNAISRDHKDKKAIFALNILLGWTALGWIASLIWSYTGVDNRKKKHDDQVNSKACIFCAESIKLEAKICRFCNKEQ